MKLICPHCTRELTTRHDEIHDETYCTYCGVVLRCPPTYGITCPTIIRITEEEEER